MRACIWNCCVCCVFCATEARDTSDVGVELGKWRRVPAKLHSVMLHETDEKSDFVNFVFRMFVVRRYRPSVWQRLVPGIPAAGVPDWGFVKQAFKEAYEKEDLIFPGNYRPTILRAWRNARFVQLKTKSVPYLREEQTIRLLYTALPREELALYSQRPCPLTFGVMYDRLLSELSFLSGAFGEYGIKLMLDMLVLLGAVPPQAISRWPTACPGYAEKLAVLFPELPAALHLKALYWIHRQFSATFAFSFAESCAQLCWDHRRLSGSLDDQAFFE